MSGPCPSGATQKLQNYVSNAGRRAKVEKAIQVDGLPCPSSVPCTSIAASSMGQTHVEASVSPESFARQ
jgi:hypothetical protein